MNKCRVCGNPPDDVVSSLNYASWLCNHDIDTFILLATHWLYMEHQPVPYGVDVEYQPVEAVCTDITGNTEKDVKRALGVVGWEIPVDEVAFPYALYDSEAKGFARPRSKHLKVYPRWTGMDTHDANDKHGEVRVTKEDDEWGAHDEEELGDDMNYASKGIIWDSPTIYTKG